MIINNSGDMCGFNSVWDIQWFFWLLFGQFQQPQRLFDTYLGGLPHRRNISQA